MKYFILNTDDVRNDIWTNPKLVKTKSMGKIKRYRALLKSVNKLYKEITTELKQTNAVISDEIISEILERDGDEITCSEYNALYTVALYDRQEQRITSLNKTTILSGKLYGNKIVKE
jgi:hypothetical protein